MPGSPVGEIPVIITGDFSDLSKNLSESVIAAELSGGKIAQAFNTAAGSTDEWTQALNHSTTATEAETDAIGAAADKFHGYSTAVENVLGPERDHLDDLAQMPKSYTEMSAAAQRAVDRLNEQVNASKEAADGLNTLAGSATTLAGELTKLAGIALTAEGIKKLGEEALTAYGNLERASIGLTAVTGSAAKANEAIETFQNLAKQDALSIPNVIVAGQRMLNYKLTLEETTRALQAAADVAVVTNRSFESVSERLLSIAESGVINARSMKTLGITIEDVAAAMGHAKLSAKEVSDTFYTLNDAARLTVLETAIEKVRNFQGVAEKAAQGVSGEWQTAKNQIQLALVDIGESIAPVAEGFREVTRIVASAVDLTISGLKMAADAAIATGRAVSEYFSGTAKAIGEALTGNFTQATKTMQDTNVVVRDILRTGLKDIVADSEDVSGKLKRIWDDAGNHIAVGLSQQINKLNKDWHDGKLSAKEYSDGLQAIINQAPIAVKAITDMGTATNTAAKYWRDVAAEYKAMGAGLGDATASIGAVLALANAHFLGSSRTIIGTMKDQGAAFAAWSIAAAKAFGEVDDKIEILGNKSTDTYPEITKLMNQLGHFPSMSEQIAAGLTTIVTQTDRSRDAYGFLKNAATDAYQAVIDKGTSAVQIVTNFNQVVSESGSVMSTAVDEDIVALGKLSTQIEKIAKQWKEFADGVGSFKSQIGAMGGIGDNDSPILAKHLSNPFVGMGSPDEMQKAMNDFMDQFAGSSPFSPGVRQIYSSMETLLNFAIQDWYKKHPFFDSAGNAPAPKGSSGGGGGSLVAPSSTAGSPSFAPTSTPVAPEIQALLNIGATIDQIATLQTSIGTLNTTVSNASTTISGSFASLSPVIQQATTQIAASVQQQAASFSRLSDALAPITAPQQTISGPLASFQRLPDPRVLGGNSSTLNTVNNMTITTTPDEQSLLDQLVIMLQRRGIRM